MKIKQLLFKLFFYNEHHRLRCAEANFKHLCGLIDSGALIVDRSKFKACASFIVDLKEWDISGVRICTRMGEYLGTKYKEGVSEEVRKNLMEASGSGRKTQEV